MLDEYFGIHVDPQGNLSRLPVILDQHTPDMDRVPEFALCLGNDVCHSHTSIYLYIYIYLEFLTYTYILNFFVRLELEIRCPKI